MYSRYSFYLPVVLLLLPLIAPSLFYLFPRLLSSVNSGVWEILAKDAAAAAAAATDGESSMKYSWAAAAGFLYATSLYFGRRAVRIDITATAAASFEGVNF